MTLSPFFLAGAVFGALAASAFAVLAALIADIARHFLRRRQREPLQYERHVESPPQARSIVYGVEFVENRRYHHE